MATKSWNKQRDKALDRDGHECQFCGMTTKQHQEQDGNGRELSVHHITPRSEGGSHDLENLISVCESCHKLVESLTNQAIESVTESVVDEQEVENALFEISGTALRQYEDIVAREKEYPALRRAYNGMERVGNESSTDWPIHRSDKGDLNDEMLYWHSVGKYDGAVAAIAKLGGVDSFDREMLTFTEATEVYNDPNF